MRPQKCDRLGEFVTGAPPSEFLIRSRCSARAPAAAIHDSSCGNPEAGMDALSSSGSKPRHGETATSRLTPGEGANVEIRSMIGSS
jgi:hypothetical protein